MYINLISLKILLLILIGLSSDEAPGLDKGILVYFVLSESCYYCYIPAWFSVFP